MPAIGPRAPERTLVAVHAIVPVTGMPPKITAALATPCATSSQFERWRRPLIPSATTAESRDSIEPSSATANASASGGGSWRGRRRAAQAPARFVARPEARPDRGDVELQETGEGGT